MLAEPIRFAHIVETMAAPWRGSSVQVVAGIEARGFMLGAAVAFELGAGFLPLRKAGKLPGEVLASNYQLEYGSATLEAQKGVIGAGTRVLLLDDVLATGGTLLAGIELLRALKSELVGIGVLLEIAALQGRARLPDGPFHALIKD